MRSLGFLIDLDGVIYKAGFLIPGAKEFLERIADFPSLFLTNNSSVTAQDVASKLNAMGVICNPTNVLTSGQATASFLSQEKPNFRYYVVGGKGISAALAEQGIVLRKQGEAPRSDLLDALRTGAGEALLATDSFWEGIDVRGEALSLLALTRLPFRVPSEPVLQARAEKLEREGGNAFTELLLPMAILKFKQGMGRLIRHREDRGIAIVLDPRILSRSYGRLFLGSLDWGEPRIVSSSEVTAIVMAWFREREMGR